MIIPVGSSADVERARWEAHKLAQAHGFDAQASAAIVLATSELATNLVRYAHSGDIELTAVKLEAGWVIDVQSSDLGPGIADVEQAMADGFSTGGGLGGGLPGVKRLMDEFTITSGPSGTRVAARKWSTTRR